MIEICNLSKQYKRTNFKSLDNISMTIDTGVYGLLGNNGAGKTTLMNILATLLKPSSGTAVVNGMELIRANYNLIKREIGYMPQENEMYADMTVRESIEYFTILNKVDIKRQKETCGSVMEYVNLVPERDKKFKNLSGGMKRRLGLALALINDPPILIADEPTTGVDPYERIRMRELLLQLSSNKTVIVSTHIIEDISYMCHKLAVLNGGKLLFEGDIQTLLELAKGKIWAYKTSDMRETEKIKKAYTVLGITIDEEGSFIKIYAEKKPDLEVESIKPTLEDAYIVLGEEKGGGTHKNNCFVVSE